ncbi:MULTISPECIES: DUF5996 family protein [Cyanophyceae]|uniref:DUF5996 family protein n=1 Tax=Cyanophyceae TaxID=3028117 RepID=UPI001682F3A3|nr:MULTISPECIES: DUF5996 family protein [Cyanophyceae]MBD1917376.1 hypothetical protein [Phormidium sp. FACHB-77]MBD2032379.1 hypothetical protein [Phormidium sp. FACHB-322]MBD2052317.1 hypothetical protein [Leptolyngbya sp. FACHB-60]
MPNVWPQLPLDDWQDTYATLHLWTQIVGKIRLVQTPWINHSWHVPLYLTARGLTTSTIPSADQIFQIDFDFFDHQLRIATSEGSVQTVELRPRSVADFYQAVMATLADLGIAVRIHTTPNEITDAIPFEQDEIHGAYDADAAQRFWRVLLQCDCVFREFRSHFSGKVSPVHFFWGSFDLAVTRFSGRPAPEHPGGVPNLPDDVAQEAYCQEVSSAGFWPGMGLGYPAFYSYAYPVPEGYKDARVQPDAAFFHEGLGEFVLPYDAVREAADPDQALLKFLHSTYEAAANLANWDTTALQQTWFK